MSTGILVAIIVLGALALKLCLLVLEESERI